MQRKVLAQSTATEWFVTGSIIEQVLKSALVVYPQLGTQNPLSSVGTCSPHQPVQSSAGRSWKRRRCPTSEPLAIVYGKPTAMYGWAIGRGRPGGYPTLG